MDRSNIKKLLDQIRKLEDESGRLKQTERELLEKQKVLEKQNINLVKRSIELSDIKRKLEDMNHELEQTRSQLRAENIALIKKSIALSDVMRELEDKNHDFQLSQNNLETAMAALRESERKYSELVRESPDPIISLDHRGNFRSFNPMARRLSGFSKGEVMGKHFTSINILTAESSKIATKEFELVMSGVKRPPFELTLLGKGAGQLSMEANARLIKQAGKKGWVQVIFRDISERKEAERALQESEQRFRSLQENIPIGIFRTTVEGKVLSANAAMTKLFGFDSREEFLATPSTAYYLFPSQRVELLDRLRTENQVTGFEVQMKRRDGSVFWSSLNIRGVTGDKGEIVHLDGMIEDISERRQAAETIIRAKQEWERTFDSIPELIMISDEKFNVRRINRSMADRIGMTPREAIGKKCYDIVHHQSKPPVFCPQMKMLEDEQKHTAEIHDEVLGGDFLVTVSPLKDENNKVFGAIHTSLDITERKKMEQELLKSQKLESLGFLAGGIAHDFNNILAAIMGYNNLARLHAGDKKKSVEMIGEVEKAINLAKNLTQQLLTFSRGGAPVKQHSSIEGLLKDTAEFILSGSTVQCRYDIPENVWPVEIDEGQISQVIQNLIINAEQASKSGGTIQIRVENLHIKSGDGLPLKARRYIRIMVKDHGTGIPKEHIEKIFDPFFTTKPKGVGLGLSTAYSIVQNHNGLIVVNSPPGKGTTFYVYLPATEKRGKKKQKQDPEVIRGQGKILMMDDEEMILKPISELLRGIGYTVHTAGDGAAAIKCFKEAKQSEQPFDAVILDLVVPGGMSGEETIRELQKIDPDVKAIVSSGYSTDPVIANYKEYGFAGAISKPYRFRELSRLLKSLISGTVD